MTRPSPELARDHALVIDAVREAGAMAMAYFGGDVESWEKAPGDPVCDADIAVNNLLANKLRSERPAYGWLSEESEDDDSRLAARHVWIVDPIDGTRAFLKGRPEFSVSVALAEGGAPVVAAVFNPATEELFEAVRGGGARLNGNPIRASRARTLDGARLALGRTESQNARWHAGFPDMVVATVSSSAYKLALVAAGSLDATVTLSPKSEWDVAAGDLLVREAGGLVTDAGGSGLEYNRIRPRFGSVVGAGAGLHAPLLARLATMTACLRRSEAPASRRQAAPK